MTGSVGAIIGVLDGRSTRRRHSGVMFTVIRQHYPDRRPPVDWTGHQYKAESDLTVDYSRPAGRECATGKTTVWRPTSPVM